MLALLVLQLAAVTLGAHDPSQNGRSLPSNVFVVGVEGSMHHGVVSLLTSLAYEGGLKCMVSPGFPPMDGAHLANRRSANDTRLYWGSYPSKNSFVTPNWRLNLLFNTTKCTGPSTAWNTRCGMAALPERTVESSYRSTLATLRALMPELGRIGKNYVYNLSTAPQNLKLLVLDRRFLDTVNSHNVWDGGFLGHTIMMGAFRTLVAEMLSRVDERQKFVLDVSKFGLSSAAADVSVVRSLLKFLDWPVVPGLEKLIATKWRASSKKPEESLQTSELALLRDFETRRVEERAWEITRKGAPTEVPHRGAEG